VSGSKKITVNLADEVLDAAKELAQTHHVTLTEILRRAISTQAFLETAQREGKDVLLRDRETRELERVHFH
jgi:predicted transcriptional regulator